MTLKTYSIVHISMGITKINMM